MRARWKVFVILAAVAVLAGLFVALRPGGSSSDHSVRRVDVDVVGESVNGPGQVKVSMGTMVEIRVTADVEDEVHVHGYDLMQDVQPGAAAAIDFDATIAGIFEVELESRGLLLFQLEVTR
jgi:hypothetical protein